MLVGLSVFALAALVYGVASAQKTYRVDGPIQAFGGAGIEAPLEVGKIGTWAMPLPWNETAADIEIESVDVINPQGLTVLGVRASYPGPSDGISFAYRYPPGGFPSEPIEHAKYYVFGSPRQILQLLIGVQRTRAEPGTIDSLRVRYLAGGQRFETTFPWTLEVRDPAP
jgi:hypothetical protein